MWNEIQIMHKSKQTDTEIYCINGHEIWQNWLQFQVLVTAMSHLKGNDGPLCDQNKPLKFIQ